MLSTTPPPTTMLAVEGIKGESSEVGGNLYFHLRLFCQDRNLGIVWPADNGYQCFPHAPGRVTSSVRGCRIPTRPATGGV